MKESVKNIIEELYLEWNNFIIYLMMKNGLIINYKNGIIILLG